MSVDHIHEPYKIGWTDRDAVWVGDSGEPNEPCVRWGSRSPKENRKYLGVTWPSEKHCESLLQCAARKSLTASVWLLQPTALLPTVWCHINFYPHAKSTSLWCGIWSKFVDDLFLLMCLLTFSAMKLIYARKFSIVYCAWCCWWVVLSALCMVVSVVRCAGWRGWEDGTSVVCSCSCASAGRRLHRWDWFSALTAKWLRAWIFATNQNRVSCAAGTLSLCLLFSCLPTYLRFNAICQVKFDWAATSVFFSCYGWEPSGLSGTSLFTVQMSRNLQCQSTLSLSLTLFIIILHMLLIELMSVPSPKQFLIKWDTFVKEMFSACESALNYVILPFDSRWRCMLRYIKIMECWQLLSFIQCPLRSPQL